MGDGGSGGDPGNRAQNLSSLLGKMLRIDINGSTAKRHYRIPSSNPYVGRTGRNEIWSRGLRNPWKFSFDRVTGTLWIGDVGQGRYEEIDRSGGASPGRGLNYGWRVMEGRHCFKPSSGCNRSGKVMPVVEYGHGEGCSVTGGYAYRGSAVPALYGKYVFADYCSGRIWTIPRNPGATATKALLADTSLNISSFGEGSTNELYVVDRGGTIYLLR
jgi:glucose/arabinose dehydrogenase